MSTQQLSASRALAFFGLVVIVLLLGSCGAAGVATTALPNCKGCHFDRRGFEAATAASTHARVSCVSCHVETDTAIARTKFGVYEAFGMWLPLLDPSSADVANVTDRRCVSCHQTVMSKTITADGIRIKHSSCAADRRCVDCHSEVGHGKATSWPRVTSMNDCVSCHKKTKNSLACATCHVGRGEEEKFSKPEFAVTHGENWAKTHGMGQMSACSVCHGEDKCARCHGAGVPHSSNFVQDHPAFSTRSDAKCGSCHRTEFCNDCHQTPMPHQTGFASTHSKLVRDKGEETCLRCHTKKDCDTCHIKHVHPGGAVGKIPSPGLVKK